MSPLLVRDGLEKRENMPMGDEIANSALHLEDRARAELAPAARPARPRLCCVVPAYNEAENLAALLPQLSACLTDCSDDWQVIVVDDGSTDTTPLLLALWAQRPGFSAIRLSRNFGKEAALTAGLESASGDVVVMMDADLQHPPALIAEFVARWREGADVVYALRQDRSDESTFKRLGTRIFYALVNAADRFRVPAGAGDFRLMDISVVHALMALPERNRFMKGLYAWVGFDAVGVPYVPAARAHGRSHFSAWRLVRLSLDGLTAFTTWPLRAVSAVGFLLATLALLYGAFLLAAYFTEGNGVSGWTTITVSLMLFAGIQLISLGVVGEYVGRIFEEVKRRPLYVVKQRLGRDPPDTEA
ncbi:MAG: glycosyltransferase family 2 protein [Pseudomonadota bacterium]|nr:glycosyltransferase family 2 protein [Pseudomonadota bacterium]